MFDYTFDGVQSGLETAVRFGENAAGMRPDTGGAGNVMNCLAKNREGARQNRRIPGLSTFCVGFGAEAGAQCFPRLCRREVSP
jgi:hypothetical protein